MVLVVLFWHQMIPESKMIVNVPDDSGWRVESEGTVCRDDAVLHGARCRDAMIAWGAEPQGMMTPSCGVVMI